ncbi:helix-turn-helix domain-containing protein [Actinokineospora sp.]|uniref:helix-turn-helix domain-containing protein n=1 Tax=Actinokineospora sp. TaxID=1872133 RepID=UPI004037929B
MTDFEQRRAAYGAKLGELRARSGMNGRDFAAALGTRQPKVSKIETGKQTPTDSDVTDWCDTLDVDDATRLALLDELADLRVHQAVWHREIRAGHRARQGEIAAAEQAVIRVRAVEMLAVPGLLQTADYARAIFTTQTALHETTDDIDDAVQARLRRQQVLYESGRSFEFIVAEAAVRHPVCEVPVLRGQIDRMVSAIGVPNIRLGFLPSGRRLPFVVTNGFIVHDDSAVLADTLTSELRIGDPEQIAAHHRIVDQLWSVAVEGELARSALMATSATL